jgi:hypothetical protein
MNFQSISYGFGRVGSNPADDAQTCFFALLGNGFGLVVVFKYFFEVWCCGGGSLGARWGEFRGQVAKRGSLNIKL